MGSIHLLLGKSRWRRRKALPAFDLSGVDPRGRPTFLYLTDTQRKRQVVEREFLAYRREKPVFAPEIRVLSELFEGLHHRHGDGRALLTDRACALVAARVLAEAPSSGSWLGSLGNTTTVAESLASLHRRMAEARVGELGDLPHAVELGAVLGALDGRLRALDGWVTIPQALEGLLSALQTPSRALVQWLRSTHSVIIDDVLAPSPLRTAVLLALCRAWEAAGTHVVLAFESGRGLGGREAGAFFDYDDVSDVAYPLKPFAATRALRKAAFDELVAEGGAEILLAGADGVEVLEPFDAPAAVEPPDLSDQVYGGEPLEVSDETQARALLRGRVRFVRCVDPGSEIGLIAREVKQALLSGVSPGDCVVALPELATYAPAVRSIFDDHGLPFTLAAGAQLAHSPVANAFRRLAGVALEGFRVDDLLPLIRSDLIHCPGVADAGELHAWCRAAGVRAGLPSSWRPRLEAWLQRRHRSGARPEELQRLAASIEALEGVSALLAPLATPATAEQYRERLLEAADALGLPERVGRCDLPQVAADNLAAWGAVCRELDALTMDLAAVEDGAWPAETLAEALDGALHQATYRPAPPGRERVQVVGVLELRGLTPPRLWLGGLHRDAFPAVSGSSFLVPRLFDRSLDPVDAQAEARYLLCSLLRNALDDEHMQVVVSWPATAEGRPLAPSPVLADWLALPTQARDDRGEMKLLGDLVVDEAPDQAGLFPLSRRDLLRAAARDPEAWQPLLPPVDREVCRDQRALDAARSAPRFGPFDGIAATPPEVAEIMGVTALETYLQCPALYSYRYVLRLEATEAWDPDLPADRKGSALHAILDEFFRERHHAPLRGLPDREGAARALHGVAARHLDRLEEEGGIEPAWLDNQRALWLAGLVDQGPAGVLRAWLDAEIDATLPWQPVATEHRVGPMPLGPIQIRGTIDRIDRLDDGALVVSDYKSGRPPSTASVRRGIKLQPVAYAEAVARENPGVAVAFCYYGLRRAEEVGRTSWIGEAEVVGRIPRLRNATLGVEERAALFKHAETSAHRLVAGVFHHSLASSDDAGCSYCDYRRICRRDEARVEAILATDGDWQRPIEEGE